MSDLPPDWRSITVDILASTPTGTPRCATWTDIPMPDSPGPGYADTSKCATAPASRPAAAARSQVEQDHTREHAHGGPTVRANLDPLCRRHHRSKHRGGWTLTQPQPGRFRWRSPLGHIYWTGATPIAPDIPEPIPRPDPDTNSPNTPHPRASTRRAVTGTGTDLPRRPADNPPSRPHRIPAPHHRHRSMMIHRSDHDVRAAPARGRATGVRATRPEDVPMAERGR